MRFLLAGAVFMSVAAAGCSDSVTAPPPPVTPTTEVTAFPDVIALPDGFSPQGIDFGLGTTFYVGSDGGSIFRGDARTGAGNVLVPAHLDRPNLGLRYDARADRIFVAGGSTGEAYIYDASTGTTVAVYQLANPAARPTLVRDVAILQRAAYFTDSFSAVLYRIPLGQHGELLPGVSPDVIRLTGAVDSIDQGFDGHGLVATPDGLQLIAVSGATGRLFRIDPETGATAEIHVAGGTLVSGDGLLLLGRTLYVVQGEINQIAVVNLNADLSGGVIDRTITNPALDFPRMIAAIGSALYAVNSRFEEPSPATQYQMVRLAR